MKTTIVCSLCVLFNLFFSCNVLWGQRTKIDSLQNLIEKTTDIEEKATIFFKLFGLYDPISQDSSNYYAQQFIALSKQHESKQLHARSLRLQAVLEIRSGFYKKAQLLLDKAIDYSKDHKLSATFTLSVQNMGAVLMFMEEYDKAQRYLEEGILYCQENEEVAHLIGNFYMNIGLIHHMQNKPMKALETYLKTEEACLKHHTEDLLPDLYQKIAIVYSAKLMYSKALEYHKKSIELCHEHNDLSTLTSLYGNVAELMGNFQGPEKAIEYYQKSVDIARQISDTTTLIKSHQELAIQYLHLDSISTAEAHHNKASQLLSTRPNDILGYAVYLTNVGIYHQMKKEYITSIRYLLESSKKASTQGYEVAKNNAIQYMLKVFIEIFETQDHQLISRLIQQRDFTDNKTLLAYLKSLESNYSNPENTKLLKEIFKLYTCWYAYKGDYKQAFEYEEKLNKVIESIEIDKEEERSARLLFELDLEKNNNELLQKSITLSQKEKALQIETNRRNIISFLLIIAILLALFIWYTSRKKQKHILQLEEFNQLLSQKEQTLKNQLSVIKDKEERLEREFEINKREFASHILLKSSTNHLLSDLSKMLEHIEQTDAKKILQMKKRIDSTINFEDEWTNLNLHFEKSDPAFFNKLTERHPNLTKNEVKHCAYIKMGLSAKDVSKLNNVSIRSVETARYRLKKKLIDPAIDNQDLDSYLLELSKNEL